MEKQIIKRRKTYCLHKELTYWWHQSLPELNQTFVQPVLNRAAGRVVKNVILVRTIIMFVASVRYVFHYLSSSSVTTST